MKHVLNSENAEKPEEPKQAYFRGSALVRAHPCQCLDHPKSLIVDPETPGYALQKFST